MLPYFLSELSLTFVLLCLLAVVGVAKMPLLTL